MNMTASYLFLAIAVFLGVTSNSFAKSAEGFTLFVPSVVTARIQESHITAGHTLLQYVEDKLINEGHLNKEE